MDKRKLAQAQTLVGGRFKLCVLLQKRVHELVKGSPKLVDHDSRNLIDIALEEIIQAKIDLVHEEIVSEEASGFENLSQDTDDSDLERRMSAREIAEPHSAALS